MTMSTVPVGQALAGLGRLPSPCTSRESRRTRAGSRRSVRRSSAIVLAGEQGRRRDDRDLLAGHGGDEGGAQRDLGLAEADIAADQAVHRLAAARSGSTSSMARSWSSVSSHGKRSTNWSEARASGTSPARLAQARWPRS